MPFHIGSVPPIQRVADGVGVFAIRILDGNAVITCEQVAPRGVAVGIGRGSSAPEFSVLRTVPCFSVSFCCI